MVLSSNEYLAVASRMLHFNSTLVVLTHLPKLVTFHVSPTFSSLTKMACPISIVAIQSILLEQNHSHLPSLRASVFVVGVFKWC